MSMRIITAESTDEFVRLAQQWITGTILEAQEDQEKQVLIGLSGGKTPGAIYTALSKESMIAWERTLFFLTDERYIDSKASESNQQMVWSTLLTNEGARARTLFPNTALPLADTVSSYNDRLRDMKPDIVILGMGEDGHIASLFPPLPKEAYGPQKVIHTTTDTFSVRDRISVTLPFLISASHRLFLITGAEKTKLLETMRQEPEDFNRYPAQYLFDERTTWLVGP
jgi:6-phosphogluconolactonase